MEKEIKRFVNKVNSRNLVYCMNDDSSEKWSALSVSVSENDCGHFFLTPIQGFEIFNSRFIDSFYGKNIKSIHWHTWAS